MNPNRSDTALRKAPTALAWGVLLAALYAIQPAWAVTTQHVPVTESSTPFIAALDWLAEAGFAEDEYLVSGTSNIYEYDGDLNVQIQTPDVAYTTRMLVRRPAMPENFNGIVVFEMMNPTAGFDLDFVWHYSAPLLVEQGYIWVGLTIKPVAIGALKFWDPARYAALSVPDRSVIWDAYAELAALFRDSGDPENPLAAYDVAEVIGAGYSQSADWLTTFSNEFHTTAFSGYLGVAGNATARAINDSDPAAIAGEFYDDERRLNAVSVPYFRVHSETELELFDWPANNIRLPDSAVFRQWEVAGTSHADGVVRDLAGAVLTRDFGGGFADCDYPISQLALGPYVRSALDHLSHWVDGGTPPPPSQYIELNAPNDVKRDMFGNALGGIRPPELQVPIGTYLPFNSGPQLCIFTGSFMMFTPEELDALYPNHGKYVNPVSKASNNLRKVGFLLPADAEAIKSRAAESDIGQ